MSDHASISFNIIFDACDVQSHRDLSVIYVTEPDRLNFDEIDYAGFATELIITNWPLIFSVKDNIEYARERFSSNILQLILKFTPKKSKINYKPNLKNSEHFHRELLSLINRKKAAWSIYKKYRRNFTKITFRTLARQIRLRIDAYRKEREESILLSASIKKFYSYVRGRMKPISQLGPLRDPRGKLSNHEKTDAFNKFFHSILTSDDNNVPMFNQRTNACMEVSSFNPDEIRAAIYTSKNSNACGPNGCSSKFFKIISRIVQLLFATNALVKCMDDIELVLVVYTLI